MKQGTGNSRPGDQKVEPASREVHPGGTNNIGRPHGNHASDSGTFTPRITPLYGDRGYEAPAIRNTSHKSGSQGKH